jgi:tyrosyl-tRNA synthetase
MYFAHATSWTPDEIDAASAQLAQGGPQANAAKRALGRAVADLYHGEGAGAAAEAEFDRVFKAHDAPSDIEVAEIAAGSTWSAALVASGLAPSKRDAVRSIERGSVYCDDVKVETDGPVPIGEHVVRNGRKHWRRFVVG